MAGKVFFSVSMSLDGFIAPESPDELMGQQWMELQAWMFPLRFTRENLQLGEGGEEGRDNDIASETFERTGASVMGKRECSKPVRTPGPKTPRSTHRSSS